MSDESKTSRHRTSAQKLKRVDEQFMTIPPALRCWQAYKALCVLANVGSRDMNMLVEALKKGQRATAARHGIAEDEEVPPEVARRIGRSPVAHEPGPSATVPGPWSQPAEEGIPGVDDAPAPRRRGGRGRPGPSERGGQGGGPDDIPENF